MPLSSNNALLAHLRILYIPDYNAWDAWLNAQNVFLQWIGYMSYPLRRVSWRTSCLHFQQVYSVYCNLLCTHALETVKTPRERVKKTWLHFLLYPETPTWLSQSGEQRPHWTIHYTEEMSWEIWMLDLRNAFYPGKETQTEHSIRLNKSETI